MSAERFSAGAVAVAGLSVSDNAFTEDVRFRTLRLLNEKPDSSQRDIARQLGVSLGTINYCLNALIAVGHIKIANFRAASNKTSYAYLLTPSGLTEKMLLTGRFLQRKVREYDALAAEIAAVERELQDLALSDSD